MKNKILTYNVWNDEDPNDNFDVEAESYTKALEAALESLGWVLGDGQEPEEQNEE